MINSDPLALLKGDLRARDRFGILTSVLGEPRDEAEAAMLVLLARLLSDVEVATLIVLVNRTASGRSATGPGVR
jgi:hypothetical protein